MPTVLVVEDAPDLLTLLELHLAREGFDVATAVDGQVAIDHLERVQPDVVVTDLEMPNVDGLELIRHLRGDPRWQTVPVLLFTAHVRSDARVLAAAALPHVTMHTKGANVRALGGLLRSLIERAREVDEVDELPAREQRRGLGTALARLADPGRLLPGESEDASSLELATRWRDTYIALLRFKDEIIAATRRHHDRVTAPARDEVALDLLVLETERSRLADRVDHWTARVRGHEDPGAS